MHTKNLVQKLRVRIGFYYCSGSWFSLKAGRKLVWSNTGYSLWSNNLFVFSSFHKFQTEKGKVAFFIYLLWRRGQSSYKLGHNGFDLGVVFVQMFGQRSHEDDDTLPDGVVAGVLRGVLQKLLEHRQQRAHVILTEETRALGGFGNSWGGPNRKSNAPVPFRACSALRGRRPACSSAPRCGGRSGRQGRRKGRGAWPETRPGTGTACSESEQCRICWKGAGAIRSSSIEPRAKGFIVKLGDNSILSIDQIFGFWPFYFKENLNYFFFPHQGTSQVSILQTDVSHLPSCLTSVFYSF